MAILLSCGGLKDSVVPAVASVQSPAGVLLAGKHGVSVISLSVPRDVVRSTSLKEQWAIAEEAAAAHGQTVRREDWRLSVGCHLAETREQAFEDIRVGAGRVVTEYTGISFAEYTSVGVGQVMEFYINFGTTSVAVGFALFAGILAMLDLRARTALDQADSVGFSGFYVLGMAFQQIGGSLMEVAASAAASIIIITALRSRGR